MSERATPEQLVKQLQDKQRYADAIAKIKRLKATLQRIARWHGEFPPTGRFWDKEKADPMSYGAVFGSNGERDYMRSIARAALEEPSP